MSLTVCVCVCQPCLMWFQRLPPASVKHTPDGDVTLESSPTWQLVMLGCDGAETEWPQPVFKKKKEALREQTF